MAVDLDAGAPPAGMFVGQGTASLLSSWWIPLSCHDKGKSGIPACLERT